jgi:hypothetical protein
MNGGGAMYAHGLATMALCEAYGMTHDPKVKASAQAAVNYLIKAQHKAGGWRYNPGQAGDTSVTGWQVSALKCAQLAGLKVHKTTFKLAVDFLDSCMDGNTFGYGYISNDAATATNTAIGLLCRQNLQGWDADNPQLVKGMENFLKKAMSGQIMNIYYYFYATQVMHHFGGKEWEKWNEKMRDALIKTQDQGLDRLHAHRKGSWSPAGDTWGNTAGRLMVTSLSLLTLEVYYRSLPIKQEKKDKE